MPKTAIHLDQPPKSTVPHLLPSAPATERTGIHWIQMKFASLWHRWQNYPLQAGFPNSTDRLWHRTRIGRCGRSYTHLAEEDNGIDRKSTRLNSSHLVISY